MTLGKILILSVAQFTHMQNGDYNRTSLIRICEVRHSTIVLCAHIIIIISSAIIINTVINIVYYYYHTATVIYVWDKLIC